MVHPPQVIALHWNTFSNTVSQGFSSSQAILQGPDLQGGVQCLTSILSFLGGWMDFEWLFGLRDHLTFRSKRETNSRDSGKLSGDTMYF